ncbi:MAG: hypothetical protein ACK562_12070 [Acidobacteriota bacterium]
MASVAAPFDRYTSGVKLPPRERLDLRTRLRIEGLFLKRPIWNGVVNISRAAARDERPGLIARILRESWVSGLSID